VCTGRSFRPEELAEKHITDLEFAQRFVQKFSSAEIKNRNTQQRNMNGLTPSCWQEMISALVTGFMPTLNQVNIPVCPMQN
jgi:hypothetical protein